MTITDTNCSVVTPNMQERIAMAQEHFDRLYGNVTDSKFGYLWAKQGATKATYSFDVSTPDNRRQMAIKAIELNDAGFDVYYGVNLVDSPLAENQRATNATVSVQTATVTDIDIEGGLHVNTDKKFYPPDFDTAKYFLPFASSLNVDSGYGLHGLNIYSEPIPITDDNRAEAKARNEKYISLIKSHAGKYGKAVDGVGDLARVLRVPGTRNYKLGISEDAPLCHVVEANAVRFTPADFDGRLNALMPDKQPDTKPARKTQKKFQSTATDLGNDYDLWRAEKMLEVLSTINHKDLEYNQWLAIQSACKAIGVPYAVVDAFNQCEPTNYNAEENARRWEGLDIAGYGIETLHGIAKQFGYSEKDARREWYKLHPESKPTDRADFHEPIDLSGTASAMNDGDREESKETADLYTKIGAKCKWSRDKIKSCPVNLRLPPDYIFSASGITQVVELKSKTKYIPVTKTALVPTKIFFDPIKGVDEYEIAILSRGKWRRVEVGGRTLADPRALLTLADTGALVIDNTRLKIFLAELIALNPDMPEIQTYTQTGWIDDEFKNFAYPRNDDCIVRRAGFDFDKELAVRGNAEEWKKKFIEVADIGGAITHAYIGTALAAILARPLNVINPQCHLYGTSGGAKTALQKFTASIFGNPRKLKRSFAATNKNRQLVAAAFCDLPTFYDELETVQSKSAEETLSNDVYNFADGKGNQANKRDGTARETFEFGGARLTTGERPILKQNDLRGAYKRLLQFSIQDKLFDDDFATELHIFSESNFGHFAQQWINFAIGHMAEIQATYHNFAKSDPTTRKYEPTHLKILAAGLVAFEYFKVATGISDKFDTLELVRDRRYLIDYQLPTLDQMDDTTRAVEFLKSFVAGNDKSFAHEVDKPDFDNEFSQSTPECLGKIFKNGEVAILPHAFNEILEKRGGFNSADKLRNDFCNKGFLRHKEGTMTFPTWFNGRTVKMIRFKANALSTPEEREEERVQTN